MNEEWKDFEYLWAEGSYYYVERCDKNDYRIMELPHGEQKQKMVLLLDVEKPLYDAIVQKMFKMGRGIDKGSWEEDKCLDCCLKEENREQILVCPVCKQKSFRYKASIGQVHYQCELCKAGAVTSYFPPCMWDHGIYELVISEPFALTQKEIAVIGKMFHYRYNQILIDIRKGETVSFLGGFKEIIAKEKELKAEKIASLIKPQPPYSRYHVCMDKNFIH